MDSILVPLSLYFWVCWTTALRAGLVRCAYPLFHLHSYTIFCPLLWPSSIFLFFCTPSSSKFCACFLFIYVSLLSSSSLQLLSLSSWSSSFKASIWEPFACFFITMWQGLFHLISSFSHRIKYYSVAYLITFSNWLTLFLVNLAFFTIMYKFMFNTISL